MKAESNALIQDSVGETHPSLTFAVDPAGFFQIEELNY
jgi:hypothetical protein